MFWTFNLCFDILATVLATFPNIGRIFAQFSGHSGRRKCLSTKLLSAKGRGANELSTHRPWNTMERL
jgi:hypothetical protein